MTNTMQRVRVWAVILIVAVLATFAATTIQPQTADASSIRYASWLLECYYGGYSWYDWYEGNRYYWAWC